MIRKKYRLILLTNIAVVAFFAPIYIHNGSLVLFLWNSLLLFFGGVIIYRTSLRVNYPSYVLWGLTIWGAMHLAGSNIYVAGHTLYEYDLIPITKNPYDIIQYDQLTHFIGFGSSSAVLFYTFKDYWNLKKNGILPYLMLIFLAGLGVGAVNEIVEFFSKIYGLSRNIGGYYNTMCDILANSLGSFFFLTHIYLREKSITRVFGFNLKNRMFLNKDIKYKRNNL